MIQNEAIADAKILLHAPRVLTYTYAQTYTPTTWNYDWSESITCSLRADSCCLDFEATCGATQSAAVSWRWARS